MRQQSEESWRSAAAGRNDFSIVAGNLPVGGKVISEKRLRDGSGIGFRRSRQMGVGDAFFAGRVRQLLLVLLARQLHARRSVGTVGTAGAVPQFVQYRALLPKQQQDGQQERKEFLCSHICARNFHRPERMLTGYSCARLHVYPACLCVTMRDLARPPLSEYDEIGCRARGIVWGQCNGGEAMLPEIRVIETAAGIFAVLPTDTIISKSLEMNGYFERHIYEIAKAILQRAPASGAVLDIGANVGSFAIPIARATGWPVICFEPQRVIADLLTRSFALNGIANAQVIRCALGDPQTATEIEIPPVDYAVPGNFGALSVDREIVAAQSLARMALVPGAPPEKVPLKRLDELGFTGVALIKIDVEGLEEKVLRGAVGTLVENRFPPIIFEAWRDDWYRAQRESLLAYVEGLGYAISQMDENFLAQHRSRPVEQRVEIKAKPAR